MKPGSLQNIWEKKQTVPSQHGIYALVTSPIQIDTNGFLHLHEMPGKILGQNNYKKPKEKSKQTNKKSPHKIQTNNPTRKEG